jgi:sporulation protein YlmC with PRC-barrel domain
MNHDQSSRYDQLSSLETIGATNLMLADQDEDLRGRAVVDLSGEKLGKVDDLMVDTTQRKVRFLRVGSGGFLGIGREHALIPVDAIESVTEDLVRVNPTRQHISSSPDYSPDLVTNEEYYRQVYDHYGYSPYWSAGYQYPDYSRSRQRSTMSDQEGGYTPDTARRDQTGNSR